MKSWNLMGRAAHVSLGLLGSLVAVSACAGSPTCFDYARDCGGGNASGKGGSGGSSAAGSGEAGDGGSTVGGSASGTSGKGGTSSGGKAGSSGAGGEAGGNGGCDITKSPTEAGCLVSDEFAVFVAPDGDDAGDGSQDAPFATLTKAVEAAAGEKLVLVCNGTYDEHVTIMAASRVYGGFACNDWSAEAGKPLFKPTTAGVALRVDTVAAEVLLESVSFEVGDALLAGETALTAIVNESPKVTFRSVSLTAGKGKAGADGSLTPFAFKDAAELNGNAESPAGAGGGEKICACQGALMSVGGGGGTPNSTGQAGSRGAPIHAATGGEPGDPSKACNSGGGGGDGTNAEATPAAAGAALLGIASASGWQPAPGTDGGNGQPGQGGGGGASRNASGHGGGGGCGGCGGMGGTAGKGGGASIALLAVGSPVVIEGSMLVTADAGNGGNGAAGQAGQTDVGIGGLTVTPIHSCAGGIGGQGGDGGAGGGAAGGVSAGIVWKGTMAPTVSPDTTITVGKAGAKGLGGVPSVNDGIAGAVEKVLKVN